MLPHELCRFALARLVSQSPAKRKLSRAISNRLAWFDSGLFDTLGDFIRRSRRCSSFDNSCDKIAQPDVLTLPAIRSNDRRKTGTLGECRRI